MRSEDEMLALVREKAAALRARRRRRAAGWGVAVVLCAMLGTAAVASTRGPDDTSVTADGAGETEQATTTATEVPPDGAEDHGAPSTVPDEPAPGTSGAPAPEDTTTTTTTAPRPAPCPPSDVDMVVTTDRPAYAPGEHVVVRAEATNVGDRDCAEHESTELTIVDQDGQGVYGTASMTGRIDGDWRWRTGEARSIELRWNQEAIDETGSRPVPPGTYTVTVTWGASDPDSGQRAAYHGSATFTIG